MWVDLFTWLNQQIDLETKDLIGTLKELFLEHGLVEDVRGVGMMLGMEMDVPCGHMVDEMRQQGVLVNCTAEKVLRFVPPLVISPEQINDVTDCLDEVLRRLSD